MSIDPTSEMLLRNALERVPAPEQDERSALAEALARRADFLRSEKDTRPWPWTSNQGEVLSGGYNGYTGRSDVPSHLMNWITYQDPVRAGANDAKLEDIQPSAMWDKTKNAFSTATSDIGSATKHIAQSASDAFTAPHRAYEGSIPQWNVDQYGYRRPSREGIEEANNLVGWAAAGSAPVGRVGNSVGTFGGRLAKTADQEALARFEANEARGIPREQNWKETGWFRGVDGKPRFEIDDSGLKVKQGPFWWQDARVNAWEKPANAKSPYDAGVLNPQKYEANIPIPSTQSVQHPALREAYPEHRITGSVGGVDATEPTTLGMALSEQPGLFGRSQGNAIHITSAPDKWRSTAAHELQHAVQTAEGHARGGTSEMFTDSLWDIIKGAVSGADTTPIGKYRRLAGEVEARATEKRLDLTPEQRRARAPWLDYDVPESQQIVRGESSAVKAMTNDKNAGIPGVALYQGNKTPPMPGETAGFVDKMPRGASHWPTTSELLDSDLLNSTSALPNQQELRHSISNDWHATQRVPMLSDADAKAFDAKIMRSVLSGRDVPRSIDAVRKDLHNRFGYDQMRNYDVNLAPEQELASLLNVHRTLRDVAADPVMHGHRDYYGHGFELTGSKSALDHHIGDDKLVSIPHNAKTGDIARYIKDNLLFANDVRAALPGIALESDPHNKRIRGILERYYQQ